MFDASSVSVIAYVYTDYMKILGVAEMPSFWERAAYAVCLFVVVFIFHFGFECRI